MTAKRPLRSACVDRECPGLDTGEFSFTQQEHRRDCDINVIMERFKVRDLARAPIPEFTGGDFTVVSDFQGAVEAVEAAQEQFMTLPSDLRAKHGNDAGNFLEWFDNANEEELRAAGLLREAPPAVDGGADVAGSPGADSAGTAQDTPAESGSGAG